MHEPDVNTRTQSVPPEPHTASAETRTFDRSPDTDSPTASRPSVAPDTRPVPVVFTDRSTPFGPPGFDLHGKIAEGGMGVVLKAYDRTVGRVVALKVLKLNVFDETAARERFTREVRAMARIEHPNLVPVYQSGEHNGVPYFTMKYMPGGTLREMRAGGRLPARRAAELLAGIAAGAAAMHAHGIVHRDLKPSNVLLDETGVPHVADFGLVKWLDDDDHTQTGVRNGTPQYMSPEQVAGRSRKLTPTCDVWALGVIGYELVCGRRPFDQDDREELYKAISCDPIPDPLAFAPDLPPPLEYILRACLCKDPLGRYPSAAEVDADLRRFLNGEPVQATEHETLTGQQWVTRRRWLGLAGGVLGLAAGGTALALWWNRPSPPPPPSEPTFAELTIAALKRGETVELVGTRGLPAWHAAYPAGAVTLAADDDGFTMKLERGGDEPSLYGYVELFPEPITVPYRLEAEIAYRQPPAVATTMTTAGLYVGRKGWPTQTGEWQTAVVVRHRPRYKQIPPLVSTDLLADPPPAEWQDHKVVLAPPQSPPVDIPHGGWMRFLVTVREGLIATEGCGVTVTAEPPVTRRRVKDLLTQMARGAKAIRVPVGNVVRPAFHLPDFEADPNPLGAGLGIHVRVADVAVRNVRLIPLSE